MHGLLQQQPDQARFGFDFVAVMQGFPRADIDVHAVRIDRNAIIRLTNDHKAISQQMEQLLHQLHAMAR